MTSRRFALWITLLGLALGCAREKGLPARRASGPEAHAGVRFVEVGVQSGLDFTQVSGSPEQPYILGAMTGGAAFFDYDGDGYLDAFFTNGLRPSAPATALGNRLYRNVPGAAGQRAFRQTTAQAGLERWAWDTGCAVGDYDNDGDVDLFVASWGPDALYRNEGNGAFAEVTQAAGVGALGWGTSAAFGDLDLDGYLDLYVTQYLVFDPDSPPNGGQLCRGYKGLETFCGPHGMRAQSDVLYRNLGNGHFADMSAAAGIAQHRYPGLGVVLTDYDLDGDPDIYVANDSQPNLLFRNEGNWRLTEVAAFAGAAYSEEGRAQASMGVAWGDADDDGHPDIFVTNFEDDYNTLYHNEGRGFFSDISFAAGLGRPSLPFVGFGTGFLDFDNDGDLDLLVANGHVYPQIDRSGSGTTYAQPSHLYENRGQGRFALLLPQPGDSLGTPKVSRGSCIGDLDNDGDLDLFIANLNDRPSLLRNERGNRQNWMGVKLVGVKSNRDGIGARLRLYAGGRRQFREVLCGSSFLCSEDKRVHFGLGAAQRADSLEVRWPGGTSQRFANLPANTYLVIEEGAPTWRLTR
jgi:hypothetical protein